MNCERLTTGALVTGPGRPAGAVDDKSVGVTINWVLSVDEDPAASASTDEDAVDHAGDEDEDSQTGRVAFFLAAARPF